MQPVQVRTAGRGRPALATGVFLLVASLVLLVSPLPVTPDARSYSPTSRSFADILVRGHGVAAAVAAARGRTLAALPIVDGLLHRPAAGGPGPRGGEGPGAGAPDRGDDTQPPRPRARRLPDPLCRCS